MTKRTPAARWARLFQRQVTALSRSALRTTTKALKRSTARATKTAVKAIRAASVAPTTTAAAPRRSKVIAHGTPGAGSVVARKAPGAAPAPRRRAAAPARDASGPSSTSGVALGAAGARGYALYKPPGVLPGERLPMLVMLHGCMQDAQTFAAATRMNRVAARERFVVLYPEQSRIANPQRCWNWYDTRAGRAQREAAVVLAAIDQACRFEPVDARRVAVAGFSAGAGMAALLASREPARFRAVAMHSGVGAGVAASTAGALAAMRGARHADALGPSKGAEVLPLLVIHGSADHVVTAANGRHAAAGWATAFGAVAQPVRTVQRGRRRPLTLTDYRCGGRRSCIVVQLCEVDGLGHAWSGGPRSVRFSDPSGPDASRLIWAFVARQLALADRLAAAAPEADGGV